ncbi:hypothetical protein [Hydrogenophaga sp. 2FB]|uniref:hypothetical protein n=1 Tax=Hydrogenophaga sp. 2FB TaxID=2502187 RepID=UPI0010F83DCC|nr:hypothetical protein [Hydrogenophaga sp. 2FB]
MEHDFLDEKKIELASGARKAVALLRRYESGWMIDTITEVGQPDTGDSDSLFQTLDDAADEARRMWP